LPPLPTLGAEPLADVSPGTREATLQTARRSLIARRVVSVGVDGTTEVVPAVTKLLDVMASPGLLGRVTTDGPNALEARVFAAVPEVAIEDEVRAEGVHRLTPFPTEDFLARLLDFTGLAERPEAGLAPITVTARAFALCGECVEAGSQTDAVKALIDAGAAGDTADAFVTALSGAPTTSTVTILHRPDATHIEGGELAWIDGGDNGIWLIPIAADEHGTDDDEVDEGATAGAGEAAVIIEPTTAGHIGRVLLSYLPQSDVSETTDHASV